jgi:hypothetical protein
MQVCMKDPATYNSPESLDYKPMDEWFEQTKRYGMSPMHCKVRAMEALCKASRQRRFNRLQKRIHKTYNKDQRKLVMKALKRKDQAIMQQQIGGLRIDFPDKKVRGSVRKGGGFFQCP